MKKLLSLALTLAMLCTVCVAFGTTANAVGITIESVTVAGNGSGNWLNGAAWNPEDASNDMTEVRPGVWQIIYTDVAAADNYQFMICLNDAFGTAFTSEGVFTGSVSPTYTVPEDGATVRITADISKFNLDTATGSADITFEVNPDLTPASSVTIFEEGDSKDTDVTVSYQAGSAAATVYSVDVSWDSLKFTYTDASEGTWNPKTHTFDDATTASWSTTDNTITVTNHSNTAVDAALAYTAETTYSAITGSFTEASGTANDNKLELATAKDTTVANAPTASAALTLSGTLASGLTNTKIGSVTVTISDAE